MARPTITTPVETTVTVLRSTANWAETHAAHLEEVFGDTFDGESLAEDMADELEEAEQHYVREQREDVGLTERRDQGVADAQKLVSSGLALAQIVFADADNLDDILTDFAAGPPSRIRSPQAARKALTRLAAAVQIHRDPMSQTLANFDDFAQQVDDTIESLGEVADADAEETQQTRTARRRRDAAREQAVGFLKKLQLAAEAMTFFQPDALEDLHAIFDTHNPTRRPTVHEEDILERDADSGDDLDEDPQAPPATGDDADVDVTSDENVEEPAEA